MLPRTQVQLQNAWRAWFDSYAASAGMSDDTKAATLLEIAREVYWMFQSTNLEQDLGRRITKINTIRSAINDDTKMTSFDACWQARLAFLTWCTA